MKYSRPPMAASTDLSGTPVPREPTNAKAKLTTTLAGTSRDANADGVVGYAGRSFLTPLGELALVVAAVLAAVLVGVFVAWWRA